MVTFAITIISIAFTMILYYIIGIIYTLRIDKLNNNIMLINFKVGDQVNTGTIVKIENDIATIQPEQYTIHIKKLLPIKPYKGRFPFFYIN